MNNKVNWCYIACLYIHLQPPSGGDAGGLDGLLDGAGEIAEEIDAGVGFELVNAHGVGGEFLIYALKVIGDENISIYLVNPKAPCFIRNDEKIPVFLPS